MKIIAEHRKDPMGIDANGNNMYVDILEFNVYHEGKVHSIKEHLDLSDNYFKSNFRHITDRMIDELERVLINDKSH